MDLARDFSGLRASDRDRVFKYEPTTSTVLQMMETDNIPRIFELGTDKQWYDWLNEQVPSVHDAKSGGIVAVLARRSYARPVHKSSPVRMTNSLESPEVKVPERTLSQDTEISQDTLIPHKTESFGNSLMGEGTASQPEPGVGSQGGQRTVRTLPFSKETFVLITERFHTHASIARVVSRADVPAFHATEVRMGDARGTSYPAFVYNSRSSNAWDMDMALTVTHFPHCRLTFAILFGCPDTVEQDIIRRLQLLSSEEVVHPLLMPGIFMEMERSRHLRIVDATIDDMEAKIVHLDDTQRRREMTRAEAEKKNQDKRTAWLDTVYLKNSLITWRRQLKKMVEHAEQLQESKNLAGQQGLLERTHRSKGWQGQKHQEGPWSTGTRIKERIQEVVDEYDDKIRDCTMRVDGMAMATQWANGETNLEIAMATGRDSRHMRSIALLTMIFLPGTFLASFFSMTFFEWSGDDGNATVSSWIWVYAVAALGCTALTIGIWHLWSIRWRLSRLNRKWMSLV